ncbi:MAG: N-glycosylase/DNA lyase [Candidatus Woesearchaeota archaeon]
MAMKCTAKEQMFLEELQHVKDKIMPEIAKNIASFESVHQSNSLVWFHELCFCILTANTSAKMGLRIQAAITAKEFLELPEKILLERLKTLRCRFLNVKCKYIVGARKFSDIKERLSEFDTTQEKRLWIAENIKGIGLKEASHFLRNTGHFDVAILDKHVKNILLEKGIVKEQYVKNMNLKNYLHIEQKLEKFAQALDVSQGELDYILWWMKTGEVLK